MAKSKAKSGRVVCYVDEHGGVFAAMAASIARASGREAIAATTSAKVDVPTEVVDVLAEIGAEPVEVLLASSMPRDVERIDLASWPLSLHDAPGELERLSSARIARDRIEQRIAH